MFFLRNIIHSGRSLVKEYSFGIGHTVAAGGEERFHSVRAGLELVRQAGRDAAHDEVRAPDA
ncbi:MAG: hypothetical protein U5L72_17455 [Bacteroidales bacterium]|nr:hypothetical protein [Bacteroidales bacterium]